MKPNVFNATVTVATAPAQSLRALGKAATDQQRADAAKELEAVREGLHRATSILQKREAQTQPAHEERAIHKPSEK